MAKVIIIGAGGVGTVVAQSLVRSGIGTLTIIDGDRVRETDLHRQLLYLPEDARRAGITGELLVVGTADGNLAMDQDFSGWKAVEAPSVWISPEALPAELGDSLRAAFVGPGITVERIVQDVHSGRLLGGLGVFFMDLAALALIFLALSGLYLFRRPRA